MKIDRRSVESRKARFVIVSSRRIAQNHFEAIKNKSASGDLVSIRDIYPGARSVAVGKTGEAGFASMSQRREAPHPGFVSRLRTGAVHRVCI